jgi:aarF domain-containing kinase
MKYINLTLNIVLAISLSSSNAFLHSSPPSLIFKPFTKVTENDHVVDVVNVKSFHPSLQKMSSTSTATTPSTQSSRKRKKTVSDRTQAETTALIRDIIQAAIEAGPRAGPARTMQAYSALVRTVQDFLPVSISSSSSPFGSFSSRRRTEPETFTAPLALRKLFERMGATYIKLGQFIASSPTLFPKEYVLEFQKCLDSTEALEWDVIKSVIEKELKQSNQSINSVFANIDKTPLASASIAQVHGAVLKNGQRVVIKVQKPNIDESLKADLSFIYVASRVLEFFQPDFERTSLSAIAGDIKTSMLEELDFEKESTNLEEFRVFLRENELESVATAPKVYREFTSKKVMVMERLDGVSMLDADKISQITNANPESTIITALNVWTTSVMTMPWFHADVHAGNLLVLKDGRVGFIDFGIVGRVSEKTFNAVNELSAALSLGDYEGMAKALCNMGATDEEVDIQKFASDIERVMMNLGSVQTDVTVTAFNDGTVQGSLDFDESEVTNVLLDIVDVTDSNGLKLPREFGLLVKQSLYFDRYLKILAPNLDVMSDERVGLGSQRNLESMKDNVNGLAPEDVLIDV